MLNRVVVNLMFFFSRPSSTLPKEG